MSSACSSNFAALQAMGSSMQSLLGPHKSLKCCVAGADGAIVGGAMEVLGALLDGNEHPMVQLLYELCRAQWQAYGGGVTTVVCLAAYWSQEVSPLLHSGVPGPVIVSVFSEVMSVCNQVFESTAIDLQTFARQAYPPSLSNSLSRRVLTYSRHFHPLSGRRGRSHSDLLSEALVTISPCLAHGRGVAVGVASRAAELQCNSGATNFDPSLILQHRIIGMGPEHCNVVPGVVLPLDGEMVAMVASLPPSVNILVVDGDLTPSASPPGLHRRDHVTSHDLKQLYESSTVTKWLEKCRTIIVELRVGAIVTSGTVSSPLWDHCLGNHVVIVTGARSAQLQVLCQTSGAELLPLLTHGTEVVGRFPLAVSVPIHFPFPFQRHVGRGVHLEVMEGLKSGPSHRGKKTTYSCRLTCLGRSVGVVTAVLCGRGISSLELLSQQFTHCLRVMQCVCEDGRVVRGGGWTEAACVAEIERIVRTKSFKDNLLATETCSWLNSHLLLEWKPRIYQAFANGLRHYIRMVLMNVNIGMGFYEAETQTEKMVARGPETAVKVYDALSGKREGWLKAGEALNLALLSTPYNQ